MAEHLTCDSLNRFLLVKFEANGYVSSVEVSGMRFVSSSKDEGMQMLPS